MGIIRVYADTSVIGGIFDEEFKEPSRTFFEQVKNGQFAQIAIFSPLEVIKYEDE